MISDASEFLRQENNPTQEWNAGDAKCYWIADENHGFIPVQQIEMSDQELKIRLPDGSVNVIETAKALPANSARYDKHEDMAELGELNEATILHTLKTRYQSG